MSGANVAAPKSASSESVQTLTALVTEAKNDESSDACAESDIPRKRVTAHAQNAFYIPLDKNSAGVSCWFGATRLV